MIVGDFKKGDLYLLSLNEKRDNILIEPKDKNLLDRVIDSKNKAEALIFGKGFSISDIKIGQDGFLYVLSFSDGILYKIYK